MLTDRNLIIKCYSLDLIMKSGLEYYFGIGLGYSMIYYKEMWFLGGEIYFRLIDFKIDFKERFQKQLIFL